jgi:amino acid adenylation domain-containing protein
MVFLHDALDRQAVLTPDRIALRYGDGELTYGELVQRATNLAGYLNAQGVRQETVVGVCARRSLDTIVALLAVLKAGGAYAPLDPDLPAERLHYLVRDLGCLFVLAEGRPDLPCPVLPFQELDWSTPREPVGPCHPDQLAYVVYTSGSSGEPKGVLGTHSGAVNFVDWVTDALDITSDDVTCQLSAHSYDAWVWELFAPLGVGGRVVVAPQTTPVDADRLAAALVDQQVTVLHCVPPVLRLLLEVRPRCCASARWVCCSGEVVTAQLVRAARAYGEVTVANFFGATEATVDQTYFVCPPGEPDYAQAPAGRPIRGTDLRILDDDMRQADDVGELFLGGAGVTRGYLGKPGLTAERFVPDPDSVGARLYRTGDLGRFDATGDLCFLGRRDDQVKLAGVRVECGEIEAALVAEPEIAQACVVADADLGSTFAYVTGDQVEDIRARLRDKLPRHMVPADITWLDRMPLNAAGKVDRSALPRRTFNADVAPRTPTEHTITGIWRDVLGVSEIGVDDDFFRLGGSSLLAAKVMSRIRREFDLPVTTRLVIDAVTVAGLAKQVDSAHRHRQEADEVLDLVNNLPTNTVAELLHDD